MNRVTKHLGIVAIAVCILPAGAWAQETGPAAAAKAEMQTDALAGLGREDLENRRQELFVDNMKFSNDEQKTKFLAVYVPYQEKLMNNLHQRKKLLDDYQNAQQNGVISDAEAAKLINANVTLDRNRVIAEGEFMRALKPIMPEEQALRAYQIDQRLTVFYLNDILGTIHLAK